MKMRNRHDDMFTYIDKINDLDKLKELDSIYKENYLRDKFWAFRTQYFKAKNETDKMKALIKCRYIMQCVGSRIPMKKQVHKFRCPHGLKGIFISEGAKVGKDCVIFQHVTIGSNTLADSKNPGFPEIGDNCFIGAGASIIGNVKVGSNCRIGANCIVVEDVPDNCVVVLDKGSVRVIQKEHLENKFLAYEDFVKSTAVDSCDESKKIAAEEHVPENVSTHECEEKTHAALGVSRAKAKKIVAKAKDCLKLSDENYLKFGFYKLPFEEQKKKHRILLRNNKLGEMSLRDRAAYYAVYKTDWSYETAMADVLQAKKQYNINSKEYTVNNFCLVPQEKRAALAEKIIEERALAEAEKEKSAKDKEEKNEWYIQRVMNESGWSREEAVNRMNQTRKVTGASYENYSICRLWELDEEKQKTFFTIGVSKKITEKYSKEYADTRRIMFYKDLFYEAFSDCLGRKCISTVNMTLEQFQELFSDEKTILYKPRTGLGGHGIEFIELGSPEAVVKAYEHITAMPLGVVESFLQQHEEMQKLSERSLNTLRIVTITTDNPDHGIETGKVHFMYGGVRMSGNSSRVDNLHSGGMIAALDLEKGEIATPAANHLNIIYENHPVTGEKIKGFKIPYFKESLELIERKCKELEILGYYGWDIAITKDGPVLIEGNNNPGSDGLQTPYAPYNMGMKHVFEPYL